jgi:uncharacterized protein
VPRPRKCRRCVAPHEHRVFGPAGVPVAALARIGLHVCELEVLRLCDVEGLDQAGAGERLGVSRGTVQRLLKAGRRKVVRALTEASALIIEGDQ